MKDENISIKKFKENLTFWLLRTRAFYGGLKRKARWFTPIGNTDNLLREIKSGNIEESKYYGGYYRSFKKYSYYNRVYLTLRVLLYAGIIASFAVAIGLPELTIIQSIASYIGVTLLVVFYLLFSFLTLRAREEYYLRRELLISDIDSD